MPQQIQIGIIGVPGAWSSELLKTAFLNQKSVEVKVEVFNVNDIVYHVNSNTCTVNGKDLESFTAIVIKKLGEYSPRIIDCLNILSVLEDKGLKFFSSPKKLLKMISRISCTNELAIHGIQMPDTIITENIELAKRWIQAKEAVVFKPNYSTKAEGMHIFNASTEIEELEVLKNKYGHLYLQEKLQLPGRDYGIGFTGGKYVGSYARVGNKNSWNTTTRDGGHYEAYNPSKEVLAIAQKAQSIFNLNFCCVDVAESNKGIIVFEVSAFGGFKGLYKAENINAAELLSDFVLKEVFRS